MSAPVHAPAADHLATADFDRIAELVGKTVGIKLPRQKRLMVESRLRKRVRETGEAGFGSYCRYVFDAGLEHELVHLIDAITTNKTDFFREDEHFQTLERLMVPSLLARRPGNAPLLKVWSAASSNGAEAFTLAMVLEDLVRRRGDFRYAILGTDVSESVLHQARRGIYSADAVSPVPDDKRRRYVMEGASGDRRNQVRMAPELRRRVRFERMNLMDAAYPYDRDADVIFLRNVLIYFERPDQEAVVSRMIDHLRHGGYFVVGHSESMVVTDPRVRQVGAATFQKNQERP